MKLLERIADHARGTPGKCALRGAHAALDYATLLDQTRSLAGRLRKHGCKVIGLDSDNTPAWVVVDLAALSADICLVALPPFFSPQQLRHALEQAGVGVVLTDRPEQLREFTGALLAECADEIMVAGQALAVIRTTLSPVNLPDNTLKVTYTSGTTGEPKGVMLGRSQIEPVIHSLAEAVQASAGDRHLPLMPLAVLLENLAGIYVPLWAGATIILPGLAAVGLRGSVGVDANVLADTLEKCRPTTLIMLPQMLQMMVDNFQRLSRSVASLRFIALGGAPVSARLLDQAESLHLPLYEGYGLSECASVTTLNTPAAQRKGSVGKPLSHVKLRISDSGEILIEEHDFGGYLGQAGEATARTWHTGDLGYLDEDGYLYLTGRKRNVFITSMGRNVSPEWVERELVVAPEIAQAAVFGEARPVNVAIVVAANDASEAAVRSAIESANERLPDYARVSHFLIADQPFTPMNRQLSGTGRNRREVIYAAYAANIEQFYPEEQWA